MRDPFRILDELANRVVQFEAGTSPRDRTLNPLKVSSDDIRRWIERRDPRPIGHWEELGREEYARAFTAARTAGADVVDDLYFAFYDTIATGGTEVDFEKRVLPVLIEKGWLADEPGVDVAKRVRLIYDTNLRIARASGKWTRYYRTRAAFPYLRGVTGRDDRVRRPPGSASDHNAWEGIILPIEHPFWRRWFPPLGFRCRCNVIQMTRSQLAKSRKGITSEAELAVREARLGEPVFASPALGLDDQLRGMVEGSNSGPTMPGRQPIDISLTRQAGARLWERTQQPTPPPAPPAPPPLPQYRDPRNPDVTAETIKVEPRATVVRRLNKSFAEAAADPRYQARNEFGDRSAADFGRAKFSDAFNESTIAAIAAIKPELDELARQVGIPALRGFKSLRSTSRSNANQGDGVMGINPRTFNERTADVGTGRPPPNLERIAAERAEIMAERRKVEDAIDEILRRFDANRDQYPEIRTIRDRPGALEILAERNRLLEQSEALLARDRALMAAARRVKPANPWKPGDPPGARPWSVAEYQTTGLDRARSTLFHEFAHHIHQYLNKAGDRNRVGSPPLEVALAGVFREYKRSRPGRSPSEYSEKNEFEWFAENFSAFVMGRRDLVDESAIELIERIFRREFI